MSSKILRRHSSSNLFQLSGELTLRTREHFDSRLKDARRNSVDFFVPFALERSNTGKLLPPIQENSKVTRRSSMEPETVATPTPKKDVAFLSAVKKTKSRVSYDRFPSPPPGLYTVSKPVPSAPVVKIPVSKEIRPEPTHARSVSTDYVNFDEILHNREHITGMDMSKTLAREKVQEDDLEELLNRMTIKLPEHIRKFKGFYDGSGLKSSGFEKPVVFIRAGSEVSNIFKERMGLIKKNLT